MARACCALGMPLMVATVVIGGPRGSQSRELVAWKRKRGMAHRTGLLAGMVFKRRDALAEVWNDKQARWDGSVRLAKLVRQLLD